SDVPCIVSGFHSSVIFTLSLHGALPILLAVCLAYSWRKIGRNNKKLLIQKDLLHEEELRTMRQQERLRQYDAMLQGQEAERNRRSEEHTSELQSRENLVCRLLLEIKK